MLWQRFGRAARDKRLHGTTILFAEKDYFDGKQAAKAARRKKREETRKRKANKPTSCASSRPAKRAAISRPNQPKHSVTSVHDIVSHDCRDVDREVSSDGESNGDFAIAEDSQEGAAELQVLAADSFLKVLLKAEKERRAASRSNKRPGRKREIDPGVDFLINAESRGLGCRRKVFDLCFDNSGAGGKFSVHITRLLTLHVACSWHLQCNTDEPEGCPRCRLMPPSICCDIHHPSEFSIYDTLEVSKLPAAPQRSRITKYTKDKHNFQLVNALSDWRETKTANVYGWPSLNDLGPSLVMPNAILDRIVDCAHHHKILNMQDLRREMGWSDAERFGDEVLAVIMQYAAPLAPPFILTPLRPIVSSSNTASLSTQRPESPSHPGPLAGQPKRQIRCGACGQGGHNGEFTTPAILSVLTMFSLARNRICDMHPSRTQAVASGKENVRLNS